MNKKIISVVCAILIMFSSVTGFFIYKSYGAYSNLMVNGSCDGPAKWGDKVPSWLGSGNGTNSGGFNNSSCIISWSGGTFNTYQSVNVSANTNYTFKFWASFAKAADAGKAIVKITGSGISDQILTIKGVNGVGNFYSCVFTTGAATSSVTVSFISPNTVTGNIFVDEFSLMQVDFIQDPDVNILVNSNFQSVANSNLDITTANGWTNANVRKDITPGDYRLYLADASTSAATQEVTIMPNTRFKLSVDKVLGTNMTDLATVTLSVLKKSDMSVVSSFDIAYTGGNEQSGFGYVATSSDAEYIISIKIKAGKGVLVDGVSLNVVLLQQPTVEPGSMLLNGDFQENTGVRDNNFIDKGKLTNWENGEARKDYSQPDDFRLTFANSGQVPATQNVMLEENTSYKFSVLKVRGCGSATGAVRFSVINKASGFVAGSFDVVYNGSQEIQSAMYFFTGTGVDYTVSIKNSDGSYSLIDGVSINKVTDLPSANSDKSNIISNGMFIGMSDKVMPVGWSGQTFDKADTVVSNILPQNDPNYLNITGGAFTLINQTKAIRQNVELKPLRKYEISFNYKGDLQATSVEVGFASVKDDKKIYSTALRDLHTTYLTKTFYYSTEDKLPTDGLYFFYEGSTDSTTPVTSPYLTNVSIKDVGDATAILKGTNIVSNSEFGNLSSINNLPTDWKGSGFDKITDGPNEGEKGGAYICNSAKYIMQEITVEPNTSYTVLINKMGTGNNDVQADYGIAYINGISSDPPIQSETIVNSSDSNFVKQSFQFNTTTTVPTDICVYFLAKNTASNSPTSPYVTMLSVIKGEPYVAPQRVTNGILKGAIGDGSLPKGGWIGDKFNIIDSTVTNVPSDSPNSARRAGGFWIDNGTKVVKQAIEFETYSVYEVSVYSKSVAASKNANSGIYGFVTAVFGVGDINTLAPYENSIVSLKANVAEAEYTRYSFRINIGEDALPNFCVFYKAVETEPSTSPTASPYITNVSVLKVGVYTPPAVVDENNGIYYDKGDCGLVVKDSYKFIPINSKIVAYPLDDSAMQQKIDDFLSKIGKKNDYLLSFTSSCVGDLGTELNFVDGTVEVHYPIPLQWQNENNLVLIKIGEDENPRIMQSVRQDDNLVFETNEFTTYIMVKNMSLASSLVYKPDTGSSAPVAENSSSSSNSTNGVNSDTASSSVSSDINSENQSANSSSSASVNSSTKPPVNNANNNMVLILITAGVLLILFGVAAGFVILRNKKNDKDE